MISGLLKQPRSYVTGKSRPLNQCRAGGDQHAASSVPGPKDQEQVVRQQFSYLGSDGRRKASLEDAAGSSSSWDVSGKPGHWNVGTWTAERHLKWNDDLSKRLIQRVAAREMNCSPQELEHRLEELLTVLPKLAERIHTMKPGVLARLCDNPEIVAQRLVELKFIFPTANIETMVVRDPTLLIEQNLGAIQAAASELREFLPQDVDIDRLCQEYPSTLQVSTFKDAVNEVKRLMPGTNITTALNTNPEIIFSTQRSKAMIPYDPVPGQS